MNTNITRNLKLMLYSSHTISIIRPIPYYCNNTNTWWYLVTRNGLKWIRVYYKNALERWARNRFNSQVSQSSLLILLLCVIESLAPEHNSKSIKTKYWLKNWMHLSEHTDFYSMLWPLTWWARPISSATYTGKLIYSLRHIWYSYVLLRC